MAVRVGKIRTHRAVVRIPHSMHAKRPGLGPERMAAIKSYHVMKIPKNTAIREGSAIIGKRVAGASRRRKI